MPLPSNEPKYKILQTIAVLSTSKSGWTKELNIIEWNGRSAKYDIRDWAPNHEKMGKGVTLNEEEARALITALSLDLNLDFSEGPIDVDEVDVPL